MTDDELIKIANHLEAASDDEIAKSRLSQTSAQFLLLQANRDACLRLAAALLHAAGEPEANATRNLDGLSDEAFDPLHEEPIHDQKLLDYQQIEMTKRDYTIRMIDRVEFVPGSTQIDHSENSEPADKAGLAICSFIVILGIVLLFSGVVFWVKVFTGI